MKRGLKPGATVEYCLTVTEEMRPMFDGKAVRDVLSTVSMIYYMEKVGRDMLLPFLDKNEGGAGFQIDVKHIAPAVVGQEVTFKAVCISVTGRRVICEVRAETDDYLVGKGLFTQAIFNEQEVFKRIEQLQQKIVAQQQIVLNQSAGDGAS